jgi:hypothetical protein
MIGVLKQNAHKNHSTGKQTANKFSVLWQKLHLGTTIYSLFTVDYTTQHRIRGK